jgi:dsRNA-specific ribonuclease
MQLEVPHNTLIFVPSFSSTQKKKKKKKDREERILTMEFDVEPCYNYDTLTDFLGVTSENVVASENVKQIATQFVEIATRLQNLVEHYAILEELETKIDYAFRNKFLVHEALCQQGYEKGSKFSSNRRLQFLGDSILDIITLDFCYKQFPNAIGNDLYNVHKFLVRNTTFENVCRDHKLDLLQYVPKEASKQLDRKKIIADVMEALAGAMYLDKGDFSASRQFCDKFLLDRELIATEFDLTRTSFSPQPKSHRKITIPKSIRNIQSSMQVEFKSPILLLQAMIDMNANYADWDEWDPPYKQCEHERLAHVGRGILKFVCAIYLYQNYPHASPGEMTESRQYLLGDRSMDSIYESLLQESYPFQDSNVQLSPTMKSNLIAALIGAMYLDAGLITTASFVTKHICSGCNPIPTLWSCFERLFATNPTFETDSDLQVMSDEHWTTIRANKLELCTGYGGTLALSRYDAIDKMMQLCEMILKEKDHVKLFSEGELQKLWIRNGGQGDLLTKPSLKRKWGSTNNSKKRKRFL